MIDLKLTLLCSTLYKSEIDDIDDIDDIEKV